jgi:hypothetical protein
MIAPRTRNSIRRSVRALMALGGLRHDEILRL